MGKAKAMMPIVVLVILFEYLAHAQVFSTLVNFNGPNGATPLYMSMIEADDENLYGTTVAGGANGFGILFQMTLNGQIQILHSFCDSSCPNGSQPYGGVVQGRDGRLYGTTAFGGYHSHPDGTIFKTTLGGQFKVLYKFCQ